MAALRKSGEEEWKKRNTVNVLEDKESQKTSSLVKQQQQQLKQQLQMASPQSIGQLRLNNELRRAILAPLDDNSQEPEESKSPVNKYPEETIETLEPELPREKRVPMGKRIMFDTAEFNANLSTQFFNY